MVSGHLVPWRPEPLFPRQTLPKETTVSTIQRSRTVISGFVAMDEILAPENTWRGPRIAASPEKIPVTSTRGMAI